ncbi:hypothetical protein [Sphingobacterium sp.]|uniref:hypothetical protein n=1 Tax=Sphingobacterium sp. TaxID=341027 RepID=UPI00289E9E31|nr:hypothetical protein [Sphingobacterium sp.]
MEPVLIYKNTKEIEKIKSSNLKHLDYLKDFYAAMLKTGVEFTLDELVSIAQYYGANFGQEAFSERIRSFVKDKLLIKAGTPDFNGVPIDMEMLKKMIALPDLSEVFDLYGIFGQYFEQGCPIESNYFEIVGNTVRIVENQDAILIQKYSYYSENDAGVYMFGFLSEICDSLNSYQQQIGIKPIGGSASDRPVYLNQGFDALHFDTEKFIPKLSYIRYYEKQNPDFVLEP